MCNCTKSLPSFTIYPGGGGAITDHMEIRKHKSAEGASDPLENWQFWKTVPDCNDLISALLQDSFIYNKVKLGFLHTL